jgi:hypothetical protein
LSNSVPKSNRIQENDGSNVKISDREGVIVEQQSDQINLPIDRNEVLSAIHGLMNRVGIPLGLEQKVN